MKIRVIQIHYFYLKAMCYLNQKLIVIIYMIFPVPRHPRVVDIDLSASYLPLEEAGVTGAHCNAVL